MIEAKQFDPERRPSGPHGWIQWKGTSVCADLCCVCGESFHMDVEFMYFAQCPFCGQVYECSGYFKLIPRDTEGWSEDDLAGIKQSIDKTEDIEP